MLSHKTAQKLQEELPELRELREHLIEEAARLNSLDDIEHPGWANASDIAVEVMARKRAFETIKKILAPIVDIDSKPSLPDPKEYVV